MNPVLGIIGSLLDGAGGNGGNITEMVGNAQANGGSSELNNNNSWISGLLRMLSGSNDPLGMLKGMAQNNQQIKQAFDIVEQNGGDMETAFYNLAKQKGVDPNQVMGIINRFRGQNRNK